MGTCVAEVAAAKLTLAHLSGQQTSLLKRREQLRKTVALIKGKIELTPQVNAFLQAIQEKANERSVGSLESLLSAILQDVMPDEKRTAKLTLKTKNGLPALDIAVLNPEGFLEDVYEGNGGGCDNVISVGLRYATLVRSGTRKFIVLDEPDPWLEVQRLPAFFNMIHEVATGAGVQTFMITHRRMHHLPDAAHIVALEKQDGDPVVRIVRGGEPGPISEIRLSNCRRHKETVIPLYKGLTVLIGPNNLGKSTVIGALRALIRGESDDTMIRHGETTMTLSLVFDDYIATLVRKLKANPKVKYSLTRKSTGDLLHEGGPDTRNSVPVWLSAALNMEPKGDLEIALGHQKSPVFLLNQPPSARAALLSVGREAQYIQKMLELWKKRVRTDKDQLGRDEFEFAVIDKKLSECTTLVSAQPVLDDLAERAAEIDRISEYLSNLVSLTTALEELEPAALAAEAVLRDCALPKMPALEDTARLESLFETISRLGVKTALCLPDLPCEPVLIPTEHLDGLLNALEHTLILSSLALAPFPRIPEIESLSELARLSGGLRRAEAIATARVPALPLAPVVEDISLLQACVSDLRRLGSLVVELNDLERKAATRREEANKLLSTFIGEAGGICPLCHSLIEEAGHEAH